MNTFFTWNKSFNDCILYYFFIIFLYKCNPALSTRYTIDVHVQYDKVSLKWLLKGTTENPKNNLNVYLIQLYDTEKAKHFVENDILVFCMTF